MTLASTHVHACPRQAPCEPLLLFARVCVLVPASGRARRRVGPGRGSDGWPFAALRVPCDARVAGPVAELAAFASLSTLEHLRRVSSRSALRARPATLRFSAAPIRPAQALPAALQATGSLFEVAHATSGSATGQPGSARRACEAPSSTGFGARARSAPRELTRRACSSAANAVSTASCATGPRTRAAQGSPSAAKTASAERRALPGCHVAAPLPAERKFNDGKGPQAAARASIRRVTASRVARSVVEQLT